MRDVLGRSAKGLAEQLEGERETLAQGPLVSVHGDAGLANALEVDGRVLWIDWEDALQG